MNINISTFGYYKKYGLLINDSDVSMVSWRLGSLEKIAVFANDEDGVDRFLAFLQANKSVYKDKTFYILSDIIGEDYRIEKIAHLFGKYKTDFHQRRMQQLFRGTNLCMSITQGREERGRRDDYVLFYGVLTENKILPWMNAIARDGTRALAGVYGSSFMSKEILQNVTSGWAKGNSLLMTIHEKGLFRHTFFTRGQPRFSRVAKIDDSSAETVSLAIRKELERTIQYLNSLKISTASGMNVELICPGNMVGQLKEIVSSGEKLKFSFHDAFALSKKLKLNTPIGELGRDSSLVLHSMFGFAPRWHQLAPSNVVRFYRAKFLGKLTMATMIGYFAWSMLGIAGIYLDGINLKGQNAISTNERDNKRQNYEDEARLSQDPPSSSANIGSVSKTFRLLSKLQVYPSQLFYYFSRGLSENELIQIDSMRWYITDDRESSESNNSALFSKSNFYQVLEVSGQFLPLPGETYFSVADRADALVDSLELGRSDILVDVVDLPNRELEKGALGGILDEDFAVDAARKRDFKIKIIWKEYEASTLASMANEI